MSSLYKQRAHLGSVRTEHSLIAERALGKPLPRGAVVHHVDENPRNNAPSNLIICPDQAYHMLMHRRGRALRECGNANWLRCQFCKTYDAPEAITWNAASGSGHHKTCRAAYLHGMAAKRFTALLAA